MCEVVDKCFSSALHVQAASRETWQRIVNNEADGVGASWYKAAFRITPRADEPWTLAADCDGATAFEFTPLRRRADPEGRNF